MKEIVYKGKITAIEQEHVQIKNKKKIFEKAFRSPGVRAIIDNGKEILLSKEYRHELGGFDWRLPGGKVFDTLTEYLLHKEKDILPYAEQATIQECKEEIGITVRNPKYFDKTSPGATIEWILYYFVITEFEGKHENQYTEEGEQTRPKWISYETIKAWCMNKTIQEEATAIQLLRYLAQKNP